MQVRRSTAAVSHTLNTVCVDHGVTLTLFTHQKTKLFDQKLKIKME